MPQILLSLSIALFAGLMLSRLAKLLQLPAVTAYLIAGILVGPFCLGAIGIPGLGFLDFRAKGIVSLESFSILSDIALGFIAFSIGNEFRLSELKHIGKQATVIGILQAVVTTLLVDGVLILLFCFGFPQFFGSEPKNAIAIALILGAIAAATAPAATLMVVRQYKAKGPLTSTLLPVVALDDAVGLVLFSISFGIAQSLASGDTSILSIIFNPILEVVLSLLLGAAMGFIFTFCERFFHSRSKRLSMSVAFVLVTVAISKLKFELGEIHIGFSSLLACMMLGTIFCNICDFSEELMDRLDRWTAPIFILFFVLSGAELDLSLFAVWPIVVIGVVYILARCAGKYLGAFSSAKMTHCNSNIVKYLGITLFPQAGVALGMARNEALGSLTGGELVLQITLFAVLIYEIVGPTLTKLSLMKAGEIKPEGKTSARVQDPKPEPQTQNDTAAS
ncbi:MAG: cation:proton antiporter [Clostridia bacterium]|nr:cation:proton antiporter [Clostridia bacterium]